MEQNMFGTIGVCRKIGTKKVALIGFGFGAGAGALFGYIWAKQLAEIEGTPINYVYPVIAAIGFGIVGYLTLYFTCSGVEYGIPTSRARGKRRKRRK
jgi:hypothetical protein